LVEVGVCVRPFGTTADCPHTPRLPEQLIVIPEYEHCHEADVDVGVTLLPQKATSEVWFKYLMHQPGNVEQRTGSLKVAFLALYAAQLSVPQFHVQ